VAGLRGGAVGVFSGTFCPPPSFFAKAAKDTSPASGGGRNIAGFLGYSVDGGIEVVVDIGVEEAQDSPTPGGKISGSAFVVGDLEVCRMCGTIYLDDQSQAQASKIDDIGADRMLSAKLVTEELPGAQA
jgi:hypothetical protein